MADGRGSGPRARSNVGRVCAILAGKPDSYAATATTAPAADTAVHLPSCPSCLSKQSCSEQPCLTLNVSPQVVTIPPFPMLRFTSTLNLLALPTLLICYSLPRRALHHRQARQARRAAVASGGTTTAEPGKGSLWTGDADCSNEPITAGPDCKPGDGEAGWLTGAGAVQVPGEKAALAAAAESAAAPAAVAAASSSSSWGPPLPGLARLRGRPKAHRAAVLLLCASCYEAAILGQNIAPRLVDPAVGEGAAGVAGSAW